MQSYAWFWHATAVPKIALMLMFFGLLGDRNKASSSSSDWADLNLPMEHMPYYFYSHPQDKERCGQDDLCPFKKALNESSKRCWGYEDGCSVRSKLPQCPGDVRNWAKDKESQRRMFWEQADFGYISQRRKELRSYCTPSEQGDSSLFCVDHLRLCQASDIFVDFGSAKLTSSTNSYREDVLSPGQMGGKCTLNGEALKAQLDHKSPLQSWAAELMNFVSVPENPLSESSGKCDVIISRPTFIIKLDATVNMFHHFCDYVNLYLSQHFNGTFSMDINILIWDTSASPNSQMFAETWRAFSKYPPLRIKDFDGKKVCFKQAIFSFLARMRMGLYYNMPLVPGCYGSSFMKAFSHHLFHRLQLPQYGPLENKIRVTLLVRSTQYRQILNHEELIMALEADPAFEVKKVDFTRLMPFVDQIKVSHNSDIFIGMHGAGLTHMLFQPDWGVIIELYNCEDTECYKDLARLRGIKYMTWEDKNKLTQQDEGHHPTLGAHAKFTNYAFDVGEFLRLVQAAARAVRSHQAFLTALHAKFPPKEGLPTTDANASESNKGSDVSQSIKGSDDVSISQHPSERLHAQSRTEL